MNDEKILVSVDSDLEDLIPGFLENRSKEIETLGNALEQEDFEALRSIGHSLKGVGGGYGFEKMSELGAEIEILAKDSDIQGIQQVIVRYTDYLQRVEVVFE